MELELEGPTIPAGAPRLIKQESHPPGKSFYVRIPLGVESPGQPVTGIFLPAGYRPEAGVDLIVYLHGYKRYGYHPHMSVASYWDKRHVPYFLLREGLNDARKNVVLVAPTLGPRSQAGWLVGANGLDRYLAQVLSALRVYGPFQGVAALSVGHIILACHSGGGGPMRRLALNKELSAIKIRECWGFDCLYNGGDPDLWETWAAQHPQSRLFVYYLRSTERLSQKLEAKQLPNVVIERSQRSRGHNWVPLSHWRERIEGASFLRDIKE
jgi:hypothetical protein